MTILADPLQQPEVPVAPAPAPAPATPSVPPQQSAQAFQQQQQEQVLASLNIRSAASQQVASQPDVSLQVPKQVEPQANAHVDVESADAGVDETFAGMSQELLKPRWSH